MGQGASLPCTCLCRKVSSFSPSHMMLPVGGLEKAMAPHSTTLAWKIPWMEEPGRLQSIGSLRVGHDWTTSLSLSRFGEGNGNPLQCSCLENARDGGAWWAAIYGITQSRTRLKWLSSSSCTTDAVQLYFRYVECTHYSTQRSFLEPGTFIDIL